MLDIRTGARRRRTIASAWSVIVASSALVFGLPALGAVAAASASASAPLTCSASPTSHYPIVNTKVGIRVSTTERPHIRVAAHFEGGTRVKTGTASSTGKATIWYPAGGGVPGYRVNVDVTVSLGRRHGSCTTWFTPRKRPVRHRPGAWCKATATVYNAYYDENNVYVHSNQPYTDARASADGYSWGYETNGNGYALVYLNGPPPGALITVHVGRAVCYARD